MTLTTLVNGNRKTTSLGDGSYFVGRSERCQVVIDDAKVSERHAMLMIRGEVATIEDLSSAGGTFVNGEQIDRRRVLNGSMVVQLGDSMLRVSDDVQSAPSEPQTAEPPITDDQPPVDDRELSLDDLLKDDSVSEIMINGPDQVYVERNGKLQLTGCRFADEASVLRFIEGAVAPLGRHIDETQPYVDARLPDGSRVNAIIAPLSLSGPTVTIRKFAKIAMTPADLIGLGTWTHNAAEFLKACVLLRKNIVVAGGTGSGKTTLLNVLSGFITPGERIVTIEDAAELQLQQPHVVRLEARPQDVDGRKAVTVRDLVKNCLRMRPDRIIVGECRSGEALDMLQAMNTGHEGSLTTVHANSSRDVISRLETMVLMGGAELPSRAIREQIASAIDVIVHVARLSDGSRKVMAISEVCGIGDSQVVMQDVFQFRRNGVIDGGKVLGDLVPTGATPTFYEQFAETGLHLDASIFATAFSGDVNLKRVQ